jgi:pimeloyl-ACP methyl ester carboxylesterase
MPSFTATAAALYYQEHGTGGEPLVLVHGFTGGGELWANVVPAFADRYRVIVPDLRGHGRSTGTPEATGYYHRAGVDLVALLDHLDIEHAHFVGHSAGAVALLFVGTQHPSRVRTLTLVGGTYTWDDAHYRAYLRRRIAEREADPTWIDQQRQRHDATHGRDHWRRLLGKLRDVHDGLDELPFGAADLAGIARPVLVLSGDRDRWFPLRVTTTMYEALPNAELAVLPAVGHGPPWERIDLFVRVLTDFLVRHADS